MTETLNIIFDKHINWLLKNCSEHMPPMFELQISIVEGEASITLYDPHGKYVEVCTDDMTFEQSLMAHVAEAKGHFTQHVTREEK